MDKNTAKNCHLIAPISQKLFSKSHSLNAAHEQKTSLVQEKLFHTSNFFHFQLGPKDA